MTPCLAVLAFIGLSCFSAGAAMEVTGEGPRENANGFIAYTVTCPYQGRATQIEVLTPDNMKPGERYPVLYMLPVNDGIMGRWGSGIVEARRHNIHKRALRRQERDNNRCVA